MKLTAVATRNIVEQADYYRGRSGQALADRWRIAIKNTVASLRTMPYRGEPCRFRNPSIHGVRRIEVEGFERFSVFYSTEDATTLTLILLIVHEARDVEALLAKSL